MAARAHFSVKSTRYGGASTYVDDVDEAFDDGYQTGKPAASNPAYNMGSLELDAGERTGPPLVDLRRRLIVRVGVVSVLVLAGAWAWLEHRTTVVEWAAIAAAALSPALERTVAAPIAETAPPLQPFADSTPQQLPPSIVEPSVPDVTPSTTATLAAGDTDDNAAPAEKLPPPVADPADPHQKRALAVGLHPGLSKVLLAKLTPTDIRNAGIAIKTALAETADTDVFEWPKQRTPELALFQVKFVPGAMPECRRYVVMVTKDGWLTTAPPMEKCGLRRSAGKK